MSDLKDKKSEAKADASPQLTQLLYRIKGIVWEKDDFWYEHELRENLIIDGHKTGYYIFQAGYNGRTWWNASRRLQKYAKQSIPTKNGAIQSCIEMYANDHGFYRSV